MASEIASTPARVAGPSGCRKFGLTDAMILTAGAAFSLAAGTHLIVLMARTFGHLCSEALAHRADLPHLWLTFWGATHDDLRNTLWYGFQVAMALVIGFTPAWIVVRLRRPRASWRGLLRQPGAVAVLAIVFGLFWGTGALLTLFPDLFDSWSAAPSAMGGAVALAWGALALSRRWQSEPGWIDRVGRLLGCVAIGLAVLRPLILRI